MDVEEKEKEKDVEEEEKEEERGRRRRRKKCIDEAEKVIEGKFQENNKIVKKEADRGGACVRPGEVAAQHSSKSL